MELVDSVAIHGFYGKDGGGNSGNGNWSCMQFGGHKIIKVKLEDGRVPFQRLIVKLNRRTREE